MIIHAPLICIWNPMKIINTFTSFQEVPNELSLCISVAGCPLKCEGCSWTGLTENWTEYSPKLFDNLLISKYKDYISCICFLGGEWESDFVEYLKVSKQYNLKTCLYTGLLYINDQDVLSHLDYLKTGPYVESLGGLSNPRTNQVFRDLNTGMVLNHLFVRQEL